MTYTEIEDEDVVISGIGAKFPQAGSTTELAEKLFAGESLVTKDERILTKGFYENLPEYNGKTQDNSVLFDNTFFGISTIVATAIDPLTCQILQRTFEAVLDAGMNPSELRGTNASVYSGTCHSDSDLEWATDTKAGYGIMGRNRCMNSNRVSYWLDLSGTSVSTDSGWSTGLSNLYLGWSAIKSGKCDTAIVSTANLQCHALITIQFKDYGCLSADGISRTFDDAADGTCRSSAVVVLVLQRASVARRNYATIGHIFFSCFGNRNEIISKPSQRDWEALFREFYRQSKIDVNDVHYVEAHGASLREEDAEELNAITNVFCKNRKSPLLIGCIKSNIGNAEAASTFCGVAKSVISLEHGMVPKNLNYKNPNSLCPGLAKGQIKVVEKNTPIPLDGWVAVNGYGYGGTYAHIVLKANPKNKVIKYDGIPRLILLADRTNDYMAALIAKVESLSFDPEFVGLLHEIHSRRVEKYLGRGYTILPKPENPIHEHQEYGEEKRPIWFIFSGMGSQWPKMGRRLMDLPMFRESIEKSHKILESKGLDLINIITTDDPHIFDNILHSFVGIAAIQVALVDILKALKITPDGVIGHSVGELGCAYADGCFTAEQMVLAAYYRGRASTEADLIKGSMAAVGKGYNDIKDQLPEGIEVACHNSDDSCTLSGPIDLIHKFVAELKGKGIFAKSVNVSNIAYHSRYIRPAAPKLLEYLKQVVTNPKPRSSKWISTSNPESKWDTELAKYCSAEYHTNNLLSSVLFEEGSKHIPKDAICIEVAPHGLLQAILKRSLGEGVTNIPLTSRSADDPLIFLLQAIGKMYMVGIDPHIISLYPKVEYPVSRGTHTLHQLVHWHEQRTAVVVTPMEKKVVYSFKNRLVSTAVDGTGYIAHRQNIYPVSVFLDLAWEIFASFHKKPKEECPVVFQNFRMENMLAVHLSEDDNGTIAFHRGSGNFEIFTDHVLARGNISLLKESPLEKSAPDVKKWDMTGEEIYCDIQRKGYDVGESFRSLKKVCIGNQGITAEIPKSVNWLQLLESLIQVYIIGTENDLESLYFPCGFERLEISSQLHEEYKNSLPETKDLAITYDSTLNVTSCGGILLRGLNTLEIIKVHDEINFESYNFLPFMNPPLENSLRFADFCFGVVLDNMRALKNLTDINVLEITDESYTESVGQYIQQLFYDYKVKVKSVLHSAQINEKEDFEFIISPLAAIEKHINELSPGGFIFLRSSPGKKIPVGFNVIGRYAEGANEYLFLKKTTPNVEDCEFIVMDGSSSNLINNLQNLKSTVKNACVVCRKEPTEELGDFKKRIQAECAVPLRWIFILDSNAPSLDTRNSFYKEQLSKGLTTNIYKNGVWGQNYRFNFAESIYQNDVNFALESSSELVPSFVAFNPQENLLKLNLVEYSGKINNKKVMGITKLHNFKKIIVDENLKWDIPESWSLEDAASIPLSYALAYYCLVIIGKVQNDERVMVTDGMTCIGQASINLALTMACRVFVTVNNDQEVAEIRKIFPQLKKEDVFSHESTNFDIKWKLAVKNEYAELIINTLDGDKFFSVVKCTGEFGRIFHFGQENMKKYKQLGSSIFLMSLGFYATNSEVIFKLTKEEKKQLHQLIADGIKNGVVKPLNRRVLTFNEVKKIKSRSTIYQERVKTVVAADTIKQNPKYIRFDSKSSYLVLGDETDVWVDIVEWLLDRKTENIVISRVDQTKRSRLRVPHIKKQKNVFLYDHQNVHSLLQEAQKLGPIAAVYYIAMTSSEEERNFAALDKAYRDPKGHLVALTKTQGIISEICTARNNAGFLSTNFVWNVDPLLLEQNLEFMAKMNGRDPVIRVSPFTKLSVSEHRLVDLVPDSIEAFCDLGSTLQNEPRLTPLSTLTGNNREPIKEFTPLIFIPGLHKDPIKILQPLVSNFMYPAFCLEIPDIMLPISRMASFILPKIIEFNKGKVFNIIGISWGTHLAMELAKHLEDLGAVVGLVLIEGPLLNAKSLVTKSLESDLINLIQEYSKTSTHVLVKNEDSTEKTWLAHLNKALVTLNLPEDKEQDFVRGATFVYHSLQALFEHDMKSLNLKGPITFLASGQQLFDGKAIWKISKSVSIRCLPLSRKEMLNSPVVWKIIHGSAVSPAMSKNSIHDCSWPLLEEFMHQKKILKLGADFQPINMKFSFTF